MANKKINQLVAKTTIQSTDLFPIGDATTGTLFKKTIADLQAAIGGAVISVNGLVGTVVLDTDDILELPSPTNKYFTEARARAAISLTTSGSSGASTYSSSTGVLNVPTYTLAGLGGITASFLSGGTGITYNSTTGVIAYSGTVYTDSSVRNLFSGGTGITYNSSTGAISYSGTVYTDSSIRALFSGTSPITYNSTTGAIGITGANLTEATSSVLTITGGTGALVSAASIEVKQASGSQNGFLSSTDWTTFNSKLGSITLTTTGTSGAATYSAGTLNIPQYQAVLTNPVTGTGTTNYIAKWSSSSQIGNSLIFDNGTGVAIGTNNASRGGLTVEMASASSTSSTLFLKQGGALPFAQINGTDASHGIIFVGSPANGTTSDYSITRADVMSFYEYGGEFRWFKKNGTLTEQMRITANGALAIGNPGNGTGYGIEILQTFNQPRMALVDNATYTGVFKSSGLLVTLSNDSANALTLNTTAVERMRITAGGNILMGTTTDNGERLYVSGNIRATGTITANSDINLKKNLLKIENALEKVEQINGYTYEFKSDDSKRHAGVIAQEIEGVLPEIVNKGNDGLLGVEYGNISALLIEAIKDLKSQNESLVARLEALEK
jgi:hypothetical protein